MTTNSELLPEYPEREIFRHGRYANCQILKVTGDFWVCHDLKRGDTFVAMPGMGHICEVDLHGYKVTEAFKSYTRTPSRDAAGALEALEILRCYMPTYIQKDGESVHDAFNTLKSYITGETE